MSPQSKALATGWGCSVHADPLPNALSPGRGTLLGRWRMVVWTSLSSSVLGQRGSPELSSELLSGHCSSQEQCLQSLTTSHQGLFAVLPRLM